MNTEFVKFLDMIGKQSDAAAFLGCSIPSISQMRNGNRPVSPENADKITQRYRKLSFRKLVLNK